MTPGRLLILSAPSGAGKTSLARALIEAVPNTVMSVSHTTRPRRHGEREGVDYYFVDREGFQTMIEAGRFLEYAEVYGNWYGTDREAVVARLKAGRNVILDIDWQGARRVRELMPQAVSVAILPPSRDELELRLQRRGQDSDQVIADRMTRALDELRHCSEADHLVMNDDFDQALADLVSILSGEAALARRPDVELDQLLQA